MKISQKLGFLSVLTFCASLFLFGLSACGRGGQAPGSGTPTPGGPAAPGAFDFTSVVPVSGQVTLSWSDSTGASSYELRSGTTPGSYPTVHSTAATSPTIVSGLTDGKIYYFQATAVNAGGMRAADSIGQGSLLILDLMPGAGAAYSTRRLTAAYTGPALRARRGLDNAEQDIGFDGSGDLDVASLTSFAGIGDAYVMTWYDQSGANLAFTQAVMVYQPQIIASGSVITQNSRPVPRFNLSFLGLPQSPGFTLCESFNVASRANTSNGAIWSGFHNMGANSANQSAVWGSTTDLLLNSTYSGFGIDQFRVDGVATNVATGTALHQISAWNSAPLGPTTWMGTSGAAIGTANAPFVNLNGHIAEMIFFPTSFNSTQRSAVEADQKGYWSTP